MTALLRINRTIEWDIEGFKGLEKTLVLTDCQPPKLSRYPDNQERPFIDMLCAQLKRVVVKIECLPIDDELHRDYFNDKTFKRQFQLWLNTLWQEKDRIFDKLKNNYR